MPGPPACGPPESPATGQQEPGRTTGRDMEGQARERPAAGTSRRAEPGGGRRALGTAHRRAGGRLRGRQEGRKCARSNHLLSPPPRPRLPPAAPTLPPADPPPGRAARRAVPDARLASAPPPRGRRPARARLQVPKTGTVPASAKSWPRQPKAVPTAGLGLERSGARPPEGPTKGPRGKGYRPRLALTQELISITW